MDTTILDTKLRPFTLEDAQATVDLFNACSQALFGWDNCDLNDLMNDWTSPGMEVEEMIRVIEDEQGQIIGYVDVWDISQPHVSKYVWAVLHPDHWDEVLYREMLAWAENLARERIKLAPQGTRVIMSQGTSNKDIHRKKALESYGFKLVRHFFQMEISFTEKPQSPNIPEGFRIDPINLNVDFENALLALEDGFQDHWGHIERPIEEVMKQWNHRMENDENFDPSLWFLAKSGNEIAGVCYCTPKTVEDPNMGWVNLLCVRRPWRRMGLGRSLLLTAFNAFYKRGKQSAGLGVDASSLTNATRLYENAGMHVTQQYDTYEMELRSGKDLATA